ncbi:hypothetical protein HDU91_001458 [Kappamyces sp. JEL0680]|nr:hypothetical protein HDU91_001458 [Kappamyces sp. JEL0680]
MQHTKTVWSEKYKTTAAWLLKKGRTDILEFTDVKHVIIIPQYKEDLETSFETLEVLSSHSMAKSHYKVCLAMEEGEAEGYDKARALMEKFASNFLSITSTHHPRGLPNEIRGKSSNTAWAAREVIEQLGGPRHNVILTVMDADTCFAADYFESLSYYYATATERERAIMFFCPAMAFDRNIQKVPFLVRSYDLQWQMGLLSILSPGYPVRPPVSAYSLSSTLADSVGGWDADPGAIGEDYHMYLKCFFATHGQLKQITIYSPTSQSNIEAPLYSQTLAARFVQSKRHMWAALDVGYTIRRILFGYFAPGYDAPYGKPVKMPMSSHAKFNFFAYVYQTFWVTLTVFESHFFITQSLVMIAISSVILPPGLIPSIATGYWNFFTKNPVPQDLALAMTIANYIRIAGTVFYASSAFFAEHYLVWVGVHRWDLYKDRLGKRSSLQVRRRWWDTLDWFASPISGVLYIVIPQFVTHTMQLYTDMLDYVVAAKPTLETPKPLPESSSVGTIVTMD